ncbi:hypothetical protein M501DRAFT_939706, partial [Patellaria atrata CBS 101060]
ISNRYIGTPFQARNTPPYSTTEPNFIPTRFTFLLHRSLIFLACYLITDILLLLNQPALNPIVYDEIHVPFVRRLLKSEVTMEETSIRVSTTIGFWIGAYICIQGYCTTMSILAVASGFMSPVDRRPTFGSPMDAYSIRRFWGRFWHQLMRKKFGTVADFLTFPLLRVLHLPDKPHTLFPRYTQLTLVFLISGLLHQAIEVAQGLLWSQSGALKFFLLMAIGIMIEDAAVSIWGALLTQGSKSVNGARGSEAEVVWWRKGFGYIWVILYLSWATPVWAYPGLRRDTGQIEFNPLPFSFIGLLRT